MPAISSFDLITGIVSFLLTVMVLSYLIWGDNPAFRIVVYIFVGVSAGYVAAVACWQVLFPKLILPLFTGSFTARLLSLVALVLGVLLLMKLSPRTARLGNITIAFLVGVGAAVAVGGAVMETLIPQIQASFSLPSFASMGPELAQLFNPSASNPNLEKFLEGIVMIIGVATTLVYFQFGAKATPTGPQHGRLVMILGRIGEVFIAITLGVLFAGVFAAAMTALIERLNFIWFFFASFL